MFSWIPSILFMVGKFSIILYDWVKWHLLYEIFFRIHQCNFLLSWQPDIIYIYYHICYSWLNFSVYMPVFSLNSGLIVVRPHVYLKVLYSKYQAQNFFFLWNARDGKYLWKKIWLTPQVWLLKHGFMLYSTKFINTNTQNLLTILKWEIPDLSDFVWDFSLVPFISRSLYSTPHIKNKQAVSNEVGLLITVFDFGWSFSGR